MNSHLCLHSAVQAGHKNFPFRQNVLQRFPLPHCMYESSVALTLTYQQPCVIDFSLHFDLKVELKMRKSEGLQWSSLEEPAKVVRQPKATESGERKLSLPYVGPLWSASFPGHFCASSVLFRTPSQCRFMGKRPSPYSVHCRWAHVYNFLLTMKVVLLKWNFVA